MKNRERVKQALERAAKGEIDSAVKKWWEAFDGCPIQIAQKIIGEEVDRDCFLVWGECSDCIRLWLDYEYEEEQNERAD